MNKHMERRESQKKAILEHLQYGKSITPIEALNLYGCMRLADVVFKLKKKGYNIATNMIKDDSTGKKYASYMLINNEPGQKSMFPETRNRYSR
jgi:hypothetical protein